MCAFARRDEPACREMGWLVAGESTFETRKQDAPPSVTQELTTNDNAKNASRRNAVVVIPARAQQVAHNT
jgi:hypothetical protein